MKVRKRSIPCDMISVENDDVHLLMSTHRQSLRVTILDQSGTLFSREYSFNEFVNLFLKKPLKP
jgi:hypothetical protein